MAGKTLQLTVFLGERTHDPDTGETIAHGGGKPALEMPGPAPHIHHPVPRKFREQQHNRRRNKNQQRELPIHAEQHDANADEKEDVREKDLNAFHEHALQRLRIPGYPREQSTRLPVVEIFERKRLEMPEHIITKFMRKPLAE